ncbi:amino acid permease [Bacillus sp. MUM 116]|uniref:amino acid permease n=1 Tax=Bacillus sp. MUM 116 TaxID=1678002 RepID=UPI0008F5DD2D|nr:amino acid permease [Bacillus sp. MUM 116]OIK15557.1 amino acid permease [Bacillus sp. MUM 116]
MNENQEGNNQLRRSIKGRHLFMLTLGGTIGTGLFLSSGYTIGQAGPGGALIAYLVAGLLMYLVMVCLGELSLVMPVSGSFQAHATKFIGPATGYMIGWVYWMSWGTTVGSEFTAAGILMKRWFPDTPVWIWSAFFIILLFSLNALTTKAFAESEYWFAGIKVTAVILFIIVGGAAILGVIHIGDQPAPYLSNFIGEGGLFPKGFTGVFITMMTVIYAFQGSEVFGVAAGETEEPEKNIPRSIRNIVFRLLIFYVGAIFVLSAIVPWKKAGLMESPFVTVFDMVGIPYAADIMNFVILTALLSVGNSGLFVGTRILYSMSQNGMAHTIFSKLTKRGVPLNALLISLGFALLSLLSSLFAPGTVFLMLYSVAAIGGTIAWLVIAWAQYNFRKQFIKAGGNLKDLKFTVPFFPIVPILCILMCLFILGFTLYDPTQRLSLLIGLGFMAACYLFYYFRYGRTKTLSPLLTNQSQDEFVKTQE